MNPDSFLSEAKSLARPRVFLDTARDGSPVAYWHGSNPGLSFSIKRSDHWINVFLDDDYVGGRVEESELPAESDVPLFHSRISESLPPVEGVFLKGSDAVGSYLSRHGWARDDPFHTGFSDSVPLAYDKFHWKQNCPAYDRTSTIVTGGWHMPWPDGDWYDLVDKELVAWTFLETEPWVEVFRSGGDYIVKQRIS